MSSESLGSRSRAPADIGDTTARYLFAMAFATEGNRATTGELRERLGVTGATVTERLSELDERGLVDYEKYEGARLTERGQRLASRIARRFCVVSTFFETVLDAPLDDETAFEIGYTLPEEGVGQLDALVNAECVEGCPDADDCAA